MPDSAFDEVSAARPEEPSGPQERKTPPSPCVAVCILDLRSGLCMGCRRTPDEIAAWPRASIDEKFALIDELRERRAAE
ncbi:MAG TPA: DUF1289 domain-containing protein [Planctomycetota bacterium]